MFYYYSLNREQYLAHYHKRSNVETVFSMVKAKFGDSVRSKTDTAMKNETLCKILAHNLCCLIMSQCELGIEPVFWTEQVSQACPESVTSMVDEPCVADSSETSHAVETRRPSPMTCVGA
jgi:hypothetical protein